MISPAHYGNVWTSWQVRANCHSKLLFAVAAGATGLDPETENLWIKPVSFSSFKYSPSDFVAVSLPCMNCFNLYLAYQAKYIHQSRKKVLSRYKTTFCLSVCLSGFNVFVVLCSKYLRFKVAYFSCVLLRFVHTWNLIWVSVDKRNCEGIQERIILNYSFAMLHVCMKPYMPLSGKNIANWWVVTPRVFESSYRRTRNLV
jgi:hypothetical protein